MEMSRFLVGMPMASSDAEKGREGIQAALGPVPGEALHFGATILALTSLLLAEKFGLHPLQGKCCWIQEEQPAHCHWDHSLLSIPGTCTTRALGQSFSRKQNWSKTHNTMRPSFPKHSHMLETLGAVLERLGRRSSWSIRRVTRLEMTLATGHWNFVNSFQLLLESPGCLWE